MALLGLGGRTAAAMDRVAVAAALGRVVVVDSSRGRRVHEPRVAVVAVHPRHRGLVSIVLAHLAAPAVGAVCTAAAAHINGRAIGVACSIGADDVLGASVASCAHVGAATIGEVAGASSVRASAMPAPAGGHVHAVWHPTVHVAGRHRIWVAGRFGAVAWPVVGWIRTIPEDVSVVCVRAGCVERRSDRVGHDGLRDFVGLLQLFGILVATSGPNGDVSQHTAFGPVPLAALQRGSRSVRTRQIISGTKLNSAVGGVAVDFTHPHLAEVTRLLDVVIVIVTELGILAGAPRARAVSLWPGKLWLLPTIILLAVLGICCVVVAEIRLRAVVFLTIGQLVAVVATFGAARLVVFHGLFVGLAPRVFRRAATAGLAFLLGFALARCAFSGRTPKLAICSTRLPVRGAFRHLVWKKVSG